MQITLDEDTLARVDEIGKPMGLNRSEIVRRALRDWLNRQAVAQFEEECISALQTAPDDSKRAEIWSGAQVWSKK